jgi:hypothetical protein
MCQVNLRMPVRVADELDELAARTGAGLNSTLLHLLDRALREERLMRRADTGQ